ncbi:hypothetical protein SAMN05421788_10664 [Filimonas lacunae]|uniref:Uncharacterized protein n=1 Tax=Filimonas lacunae TaxID=477680 RepID=A0A173MEP8_9BACT|nr:contractile injection system tape measure protein [Filimonas lacunae]BAV05990.1 hypothetical protein FLA_2005 [Filimonas lacunae]SIT24079.1 hypothetical protein SAMN05421788_10664 [Filimonas lacunae]
MSDDSSHIQSLVFDVGLRPREKAHELQNRISRLFTYQLESLLQQFFSESIPDGVHIKIDSLTLDLGNITLEQLEKELPERLLQALHKAFDFSFTPGGRPAAGATIDYTITTTEAGYLRLLVYFLQTGSFPWWAGVSTVYELEDVIERLYKNYSKELRAVLLREGKNESVRRRIAWQFNESVIQKIVEVLEPAESLFILAYHKSITRQQEQYALVKSGTEDFQRALWLFILSFLLAEKETWFSRKMFIKSTLRQMSAHFNVGYTALLGLLYQALYAAGVDIEHARLTWFMKVVLEEELHTHNAALPTESNGVATDAVYDLLQQPVIDWAVERAGYTSGHLQLKNLLAYFIETGGVPRWGQYTPGSIVSLMEQLLNQHPREALALLQWAGSSDKRMHRFLLQFPAALVQRIFALLPSGEEAVQASVLIQQLATAGSHPTAMAITAQSAEKTLLRLLWHHYAETYYQTFHVGSFYIQGLKHLFRLPGHTWYALLPELNRLFSRGDTESLQQIIAWIGAINEQGQLVGGFVVKQDAAQQTLLKLPEVKRLLLSIAGQEYRYLPLFPALYGKEETVDNATALLTAVAENMAYYLTWNSMPDALQVPDEATGVGLLTDMVLYLFEKDRARLKSLLMAPVNSYTARKSIYQLFNARRGGKDALILQWLSGFIQADMMAYLGDQPFSASEGYKRDTYKGVTLMKVARILNRFYQTPTVVPLDEQQLLQQALQTLDHFFTYNSLPAALDLQGVSARVLIQYLFRWVLGKNSAALSRLLQKTTHAAEARIQLHSWFGSNEFVNGESVAAFTAIWLQQDVLAYLRQHTDRDITQTPAWHKLVRWQQLPVGVITYISRHYRMATIQQWMERENYTWLENMQPAVLVLQLLFTDAAGVGRDWPSQLLNEFLLLAFAGHVMVKDAPEFIKQFFAFADKRIPPPVYKVYERIGKALPVLKVQERGIARELVAVVEREVITRLQAAPPKQRLPIAGVIPAPDTASTVGIELPREKMEKIYVHNAGLVLLHPFFSFFFSKLNLTEKSKFIDEDALFRALHLTQHLVDGVYAHEEHTLCLNKILCGVELATPVPLSIEPLPEEIAMAESLFQAVFQQWSKMKSSSVEGFRNSFLLRDGVLTRGEDHWMLKVEQRGYDLLLQTLPWSYGSIRLPWMKEVLYVEWI